MQFRGPCPNVINANWLRLISGENLSGLNSWASSPQISLSKCNDKTSTAIDAPTGISIPLTFVEFVQRLVTTLKINEKIIYGNICNIIIILYYNYGLAIG